MKLQSLILIATFLSCFSTSYAQVGTCEQAEARAILEAGNIRAGIFNDGTLFWKGGQNLYESPKNSGLHSMFSSTFVVAGLINGQLRAATTSYGPYEFWPGPLDTNGAPPSDCSEYDRIWEIHDDDFALLDNTGAFSENMRNWPWQLGAPVIDGDGNPNNYNLEGGDRPELLGNQTLWWIMNDRGNDHTWSETLPLGIEVRATAYAFEQAGPLGDITFYRYHITNKNTKPITDIYAGMWLDPDLGNASDDYVGSDSLLHLAFAYNGVPIDEGAYEDTPPAIGYTYLLTPKAQVDGIDNDHDGAVDESGETTGMHAASFFGGGGGIQGDPSNGSDMYNYLRGFWTNGEPMTYGGTGLGYSNRRTRFAFSGDPVTMSFWSEFQPSPTGELRPNSPSDQRFMSSSGPFKLLPEESTELLLALVWARGENYLDSVRKLKNIAANLQSSSSRYLISGYQPETQAPPPPPEYVLGFDQNFPNPFTDATTIRYSLPKTMHVRLSVYDILGKECVLLIEASQEAGIYSIEFDASELTPGIYFARIEMDHLQFTKKLVKTPNE